METERLKKTLEKALKAARTAVLKTTRVTRMLTVLNESAPLGSLLDNILSTISELFMADIVVLFNPSGTGNFRPIASLGIPEENGTRSAGGLDLERDIGRYQYFRGRNTDGPQRDSRDAVILHMLGAETETWIPMKAAGELRGGIFLARCRLLPFTQEETSLLSAMAYRIALTLEQIQQKKQLELIVSGNNEMLQDLDEPSVEREAVRSFPGIMGAEAAALFIGTGDNQFLCTSASGTLAAIAPGRLRFKTGSGLDLMMPVPGIPCFTDTGERFAYNHSGEFPYRSVLAIPLYRKGRPAGLLCAFRADPVDFTGQFKQLAVLYSGQIMTALENARLYNAVQSELRERIRMENALRENEEKFMALIHNITDVIVILAEDGKITYAGNAVLSQWGIAPEDIVGTFLIERVHPDDVNTARSVFTDVLVQSTQNLTAVVRLKESKSGSWRYFDVIISNLLHDASVMGIIATFHDINDRKLFEKELTELAFHDSLTGLANRSHFCDRVRIALSRNDGDRKASAVIFCDLDNFKNINDTLGHAAGDEILRFVAERMRGCTRSNDIAARLGGDEFTVLIEKVETVSQLIPVVERLQKALREPLSLQGKLITIGSSIGIAISDPETDNVDSLLHKADLAMYRAKIMGKNQYVFYDSLDGKQQVGEASIPGRNALPHRKQ